MFYPYGLIQYPLAQPPAVVLIFHRTKSSPLRCLSMISILMKLFMKIRKSRFQAHSIPELLHSSVRLVRLYFGHNSHNSTP